MGLTKGAFQNLIGLVFPSRCVICESPLDPLQKSPLCIEHSREIRPVKPPACSKCGRKMYGETVEELICAKCRATTVHYDTGYSAYIYADPLKELIHLFKYGKRRYLRFYLGELLVGYLRERGDLSGYDAIVPVPLHWRRHWSRGFNQAADLGKALSKGLGIPIMKKNLRRVRNTRPQVWTDPKEREDNIKNAFEVRCPERMAGKKLILLDDVITTGATLNECARVLKRAGASIVTIVTLAHASDVQQEPAAKSPRGAAVQT